MGLSSMQKASYKIVNDKDVITIYKNVYNWYFIGKIFFFIFSSFNFFWLFTLLTKAPRDIHTLLSIFIILVLFVFIVFYLKDLETHINRHLTPLITIKEDLISLRDTYGEKLHIDIEEIRSIHGQVFDSDNIKYVELSLKLNNGEQISLDTIYNFNRSFDNNYEITQGLKDKIRPITETLTKAMKTEFFMNNSIKKLKS